MKVEIKGWDWMETAAIFGIDIEAKKYQSVRFIKKLGQIQGEYLLAQDIRTKLNDLFWKLVGPKPVLTGEEKVQIRQLRKFAKAIYLQSMHTCKPIWLGLCNIGDDSTFVRWISELLEHMWT